MINPYHIQPGLLLDVDITSIKRKKATLDSMANVLNEFLHGVSKGFQDAAFASFSRRRSTVRADINQSFSSDTDAGPAAAVSTAPAQAYLDLLNSDDAVTDMAADPGAAKATAGVAETKPAKKPVTVKPAKKSGGRSGGDELREI
jgi:hypothetical protein